MKIKPIGKIVIIIVVCALAFFGIKSYQKSHPSTVVVKADTTVKQQDTIAVAKQKDTITTVSIQPTTAKIPVHHDQVKKTTSPVTKTKKKGDDRENVKLENF